VLDKAVYITFESTLNSSIVPYRICMSVCMYVFLFVCVQDNSDFLGKNLACW